MNNETYQIIRNSFIPDAEKFADATTGKKPTMKKGVTLKQYTNQLAMWAGKWNSIFFKKMDDMARENGLIT